MNATGVAWEGQWLLGHSDKVGTLLLGGNSSTVPCIIRAKVQRKQQKQLKQFAGCPIALTLSRRYVMGAG